MTVFTFWFPLPLCFSVCFACLDQIPLQCRCSLLAAPAQTGTEAMGWNLQGCTLQQSEPFPQRVLPWILGALGIRNMDIVTLSKNLVSCEGGDTTAVTLDCDRPLWVPGHSPGMSQGGCARLPGDSSVELKGESFLLQLPQQTLTDREVKRLPHFHMWKPCSDLENVRRLFLESTRDRESSSSHSLQGAQQQELEGFCSLPIAVNNSFPSSLPWG